MSFSVELKKNSSPSLVVSKNISPVAAVTGTLRDGTSIVDPHIVVEATASTIAQVNYAYISTFGRYYYVLDHIALENGLWELPMHVDVLMTYNRYIRSQSGIVARQEFNYNMYLDDGWFMAYQRPLIETRYLSETAPFENSSYVLILAGSG